MTATDTNKTREVQSDDARQPTSWPRRLLWALGIICICVVFILAAFRIFITTAPGHSWIEHQLNNRSFGPVEGLTIKGLSGDPLASLRVQTLSVRDAEGAWVTAKDITLDWSPWALVSGHLKVNTVDITRVEVTRQPKLNDAQSSEGTALQFTVSKLNIPTLDLKDPVLGQAAQFKINGGLELSRDIKIITLDAARIDGLDGDNDSVALKIRLENDGNIRGDFDLRGAADAPLATLLRAPAGQAVNGTGQISGTDISGEGQLSLRFGPDTEALTAAVTWDAARLKVNSTARAKAWPMVSDYAAVLGETTVLNFALDRSAAPQSFETKVIGRGITASARGVLPPASSDSRLPEQATIDVRVDASQSLLDVPEGYGLGPLRVTGTIQNLPQRGFNGTVSVRNMTSPYGTAAMIMGPVRLSQEGSAQMNFNLDLTASGVALAQDYPVSIADTVSVKSSGRYNTDSRGLLLTSMAMNAGDTRATAKGRANLAAGSYDISGGIKLAVMSQGPVPAGQLQADYRLDKTANSAPALSTQGRYDLKTDSDSAFNDVLGQSVIFDSAMSPIPGGVNIASATIEARGLRAAVQGSIADSFDLSIEAVNRAAFRLGTIDINESAELSATVSGPRDAPNLRLQTRVGQITAAGQTLSDLQAKIDLDDILNTPRGPVEIIANTDYGPLRATTQFTSRANVIRADDITLTLGILTARGDLAYLPTGLFDGALSLDLPQDADSSTANASLTLSANDIGAQGVSLSASGTNIAFADFEIDGFTADAKGTLSALTGDIEFKGQYKDGIFSRPIALSAPFTLSAQDDAVSLSIKPDGRYAAVDLTSQSSVTVNYKAGTLEVTAPLLVTGKPLSLNYRRDDAGEALILSAQDMPMTLLPLPGPFADSMGQWSTDIDLTASAAQNKLSGNAAINISDWRGFGAERDTGLTLDLTTTLNDRSADLSLTGGSPSGFDMAGDMAIPVNSGASLASIRADMTRAISGQLRANGAAQTILGLGLPASVELDGTVDLSVDMTGTLATPKMSGRASAQSLQFEAPELGTQIRNGRFTAVFDNENLRVSDVVFNDASDGRASGQGVFKLGALGRPIGTLSISTEQFSIIDRRDVTARMSGNVSYESAAKRSKISGDIRIGEAIVKQLAAGGASVIEIDVEEINKPDYLKSNDDNASQAPALPIDLDITVNAPRKIFIRSKGLDVELSARVKIGGTVSQPAITGRAEIVRGGYNIAGKTLAFSSGSIVFNGPISTARVALRAQAETTNLTASVSIDGTVEKPEITLSSSPERPDDEILSALLFGRSATELSAIEAAQLAGALAQFSGSGVGFDLLGGLRDSLGIAELSVGVSEDGSAQITGGRYLARNVYLQVFSGAGADQTGAVISWELRRNIALRSKIQADNEQSLSLRYKYDF